MKTNQEMCLDCGHLKDYHDDKGCGKLYCLCHSFRPAPQGKKEEITKENWEENYPIPQEPSGWENVWNDIPPELKRHILSLLSQKEKECEQKVKEAYEEGRSEGIRLTVLAGKFDLADFVAQAKEGIEKLRAPNRQNPKDVRIAEALGKTVVRKGPIAQARTDGYVVALQEVFHLLDELMNQEK